MVHKTGPALSEWEDGPKRQGLSQLECKGYRRSLFRLTEEALRGKQFSRSCCVLSLGRKVNLSSAFWLKLRHQVIS